MSRIEIIVVRFICDGCGKIEEGDIRSWRSPSDWKIIGISYQGTKEDEDEDEDEDDETALVTVHRELTFCSDACYVSMLDMNMTDYLAYARKKAKKLKTIQRLIGANLANSSDMLISIANDED